LYLSPTTK